MSLLLLKVLLLFLLEHIVSLIDFGHQKSLIGQAPLNLLMIEVDEHASDLGDIVLFVLHYQVVDHFTEDISLLLLVHFNQSVPVFKDLFNGLGKVLLLFLLGLEYILSLIDFGHQRLELEYILSLIDFGHQRNLIG